MGGVTGEGFLTRASLSLPIASVRRRNALHEVGGRVPEVPRVRNARAGSETHTNILFSHNPSYALIKKSLKNHQKKSLNTLNSRVKSSIFKGKMLFSNILFSNKIFYIL
jgi:hypothetical protein